MKFQNHNSNELCTKNSAAFMHGGGKFFNYFNIMFTLWPLYHAFFMLFNDLMTTQNDSSTGYA